MSDSADELARLRLQVEHLDARLARLEQGRKPPVASASGESRFELTAVNRIGAFTLAIGIAFFFKYAADNLYIAATGRVVLGVVCGGFFLAAAEWLHRRAQSTFAQGIAGCGIATLYISVYAASTWYRLLGSAESFIFVSSICAVAIGLSFRYANSVIAAIGLLGGVLTPLLLHNASPSLWPDSLYLLALDFSCVVIVMRRGGALLVPAVGAATLSVAWLLFDIPHPEAFAGFAFALAALHGIAASRSDGPAREALCYTAHGCFIAGALREVALWAAANVAAADRGSLVSELGSVLLAVYGVAALVYASVRSSPMNRTLALFILGLVIAKLYLWDVWFLRHVYRTTAFVALGILLLCASWIYSRSRPGARG